MHFASEALCTCTQLLTPQALIGISFHNALLSHPKTHPSPTPHTPICVSFFDKACILSAVFVRNRTFWSSSIDFLQQILMSRMEFDRSHYFSQLTSHSRPSAVINICDARMSDTGARCFLIITKGHCTFPVRMDTRRWLLL